MDSPTAHSKNNMSSSIASRHASSYDKISVCIRIRPLNERESKLGSPAVWGTSHNSLYQCNSKTGAPIPGSTVYSFDHVYDSASTTSLVYEQVAQRIVQSVVQGYNGTIFAYGQTSSGKTFTMKGTEEETGIIPQSVYEVFDTIMRTQDREFLIRVSYLEIYNEVIMDLLDPESKNLKIHEDLHRGIFVGGLKEQSVTSPDEILELMANGERHRHVGSTNMNERSSRSHTIFRLIIESRVRMNSNDDESCESQAVRVATLNLVDLAGSERVQHTGSEGQRLVEGGHINKSLLTLGTVIGKLSEGGVHIPYRDSKLTRILQPALGGNSRTAIICTITPAAAHAEESLSTLKFAGRAKSITNEAHINEIIRDQNLMQKHKKEAAEWKAKYETQLEVCEQLTQQNSSLKTLMATSEAHSFELQQKIEQKTKIATELTEQVKRYEQELFQVKEQLRIKSEQYEKDLNQAKEFQNQELKQSKETQEQVEKLNEQIQSLTNQLQEQDTAHQEQLSALKTKYDDMLLRERANFDSMSREQLQKCLELEEQIERTQTLSSEHSEQATLIAEELQKQAEEFESEKMELIEQFELDRNDMVQQFLESEKELQSRIDELEQEKSEFVVDNTGTYEKVNTLQRQIIALKTENQELRTKLQKRKRVSKKNVDNVSSKRVCLGALQENVINNESNKENALVAPH